MITKQAYDLEEIRKRPMPEVAVSEMGDIKMYRTKRTATLDPYVFYLQCLLSVYPNIINDTSFTDIETTAHHISKENFLEQVEHVLSTGKDSHDFELRGEYIDAIHLAEGDTQTLLCETSSEVVFFNWKMSE